MDLKFQIAIGMVFLAGFTVAGYYAGAAIGDFLSEKLYN